MMVRKLESPIFTYLLYRMGIIFNHSRWNSVHYGVQLFYIKIVCPILQYYFQLNIIDQKVNLIARHSVTTKNGFNLFFSDLDLSLIFQKEPNINTLNHTLRKHYIASWIIKAIGELEIYTDSELNIKNKLQEKHGKMLDIIWDLRKWSWQILALKETRTEYHQYKAKKAISKIQAKLIQLQPYRSYDPHPENFAPFMEGILESIFTQKAIDISKECEYLNGNSHYLGWKFENINPLLLAILPDGDRCTSIGKSEIDKLREIPEVKTYLSTLCQFELLLIKSVSRVYGTQPSEHWLTHLRKTFSKYS